MAVVELRGAAQHFGDDTVSDFEFFENRDGLLHKEQRFTGTNRLRIESVASRRHQFEGGLHVLRADGVEAGLAGAQPRGARQHVQ